MRPFKITSLQMSQQQKSIQVKFGFYLDCLIFLCSYQVRLVLYVTVFPDFSCTSQPQSLIPESELLALEDDLRKSLLGESALISSSCIYQGISQIYGGAPEIFDVVRSFAERSKGFTLACDILLPAKLQIQTFFFFFFEVGFFFIVCVYTRYISSRSGFTYRWL